MSDRVERFYQILVQLQFKFLVTIFLAILFLQVGWMLQNQPPPLSYLGFALYYSVYVLGIIALNVFAQHKHIINNIELYVPKPMPKPFSKFDIHLDSDVLTDNELNVLLRWAHGESVKKMDIHPMVINRLLRKYVNCTLKFKEGEYNEEGNSKNSGSRKVEAEANL